MKAPGSICRCGGIVRDKVCNRCGPKRERQRTQEERPHNNRRWYKLSKRVIDERQFCQDCEGQGRITLATQVHHVKKADKYPELMYDEDNLRVLCAGCHSVRTRKGE